jgi:O-antigen/teichoic acid export membrane protein
MDTEISIGVYNMADPVLFDLQSLLAVMNRMLTPEVVKE